MNFATNFKEGFLVTLASAFLSSFHINYAPCTVVCDEYANLRGFQSIWTSMICPICGLYFLCPVFLRNDMTCMIPGSPAFEGREITVNQLQPQGKPLRPFSGTKAQRTSQMTWLAFSYRCREK